METALARQLLPTSIASTVAADLVAVGARLTLRPWDRRKDRQAQDRWPADPSPFAQVWRIQAHNPYPGPRVSWAIRLREDESTIGRVTLRDIDSPVARLGIYVAAPWTGRGLGSEALRLLLDASFNRMGFEQIALDVAASNQRALKCYMGLGFQLQYHEWRKVGSDPALKLLESEEYAHLRSFFDLSFYIDPCALFFELALCASAWQQEINA